MDLPKDDLQFILTWIWVSALTEGVKGARVLWERCLDEPYADSQHLASVPELSSPSSQRSVTALPHCASPPRWIHSCKAQEILLKLWEKKLSFLVVLVRQTASQQGQEQSILGCTMQLFPRHLLKTPVSLKIILLLPAHHKKIPSMSSVVSILSLCG